MKGDFSRFSFDPARHYSGVLLQQGRVQTDADWNEQAEITAHRHATGLRDLIGPAGVPRDRAGYAIAAHGGRSFDGEQSCIEHREHHPLHFDGNGYAIEGWVKPAKEGPSMAIARADYERRGEDIGGFRFGMTRDGRLRFERLELRPVGVVEIEEIDVDVWGDVVEEDIVIEIDRIARARIVGNARLPVGRFTHVTAVCRDGLLQLFVDGRLDAERPAGNGTPFNSSPMLIGCDYGRSGPRHHFAGTMDRLRLWHRPLDRDAIAAACAGELRAPEHGCRWLLDGVSAHQQTDRLPPFAPAEIRIGAGRCYVDGLACENEHAVLYQDQPDCPGLAPPDRSIEADRYLVYLDVWQRVVSAIEDENIREPALGGVDTAVRTRTIAQVRLAPLAAGDPDCVPPRPQPGSLRVTRTPDMSLQENQLYRVEIHDSGAVESGSTPEGGATFKWSRENGSSIFAVTKIDAPQKTVTIDDPNCLLQPDDWIEIVDDDMALGGRAAPLCKVLSVENDDLGAVTVTLEHPCDGGPFDARRNKHPLLRRWDGIDGNSRGVKSVTTDEATTLAGGIHLRFGPGSYATGDYWVVPIREHLAWPVDEKGHALARKPQGIRHRYAELATLSFVDSRAEVRDLRRIFAPLVDAGAAPAPASPASAPASHGGVPVGCSILGPSPQPPPGWAHSGARLALLCPDPAWRELETALPEAGPVLAAAAGGTIFCLFESGDLWAFNPQAADPWTVCARLDDANLAGAALAALDGRLHVLGGYGPDGDATARHRCYDAAADEWHDRAPLPGSRAFVAAAALGGRLFAVGGSPTRAPEPLDIVEAYDPGNDAWTLHEPLLHATSDAALGVSGGRLYLFGGIVTHLLGLERQASMEAHVYSSISDAWSSVTPLLVSRNGAGVAHADDRLYVVSGTAHDGGPAPIEAFAPSSGNRLDFSQPRRARTRAGVATLHGTIYLLGGVTPEGPTATIESCTVEHVFHVHTRLAPAG